MLVKYKQVIGEKFVPNGWRAERRNEVSKLNLIAVNDIEVLNEKGKVYGDSWKKRGGVGAFMMLARKWDRIENQMQASGDDIFKCDVHEKDGLLDDIQDLRRYLMLVEEELLFLNERAGKDPIRFKSQYDNLGLGVVGPGITPTAAEQPGRRYVNQD